MKDWVFDLGDMKLVVHFEPLEYKNFRYKLTGKEDAYKGGFQEPKKVLTAKINWVKRKDDAKD